MAKKHHDAGFLQAYGNERDDGRFVILTGHELTAIPSAVAMLAIVGGYIGVRTANNNALSIAREERSSRRQGELTALRRTTYARLLAALTSLASAALEQEAIVANAQIHGEQRIGVIMKKKEALTEARNIVAELKLLAAEALRDLANNTLETARLCSRENEAVFIEETAKLRAAMRRELDGTGILNMEMIDRSTHDSIAMLPSVGSEENAPATLSAISNPDGQR